VTTQALPSLLALAGLFVSCGACTRVPQAGTSDEWTDPDTGHRVVRLSRRDGSNRTFCFHQNPFTADGDKMVFTGSTDKGRGAFSVDLESLEVRGVVTDRSVGFEVVAPKRRELFYISGDTIYSTHLDTLATRAVCQLPEHYRYGRGLSVNADETLLLGCYAKGEQEYYKKPRKEWVIGIFEAKLPNVLYTIDVETGAVDEFHRENEWIGHAQFSPTDPTLIEFCHEGPERRLHRMWCVHADGTGLRSLHKHTTRQEFVTHEFWDPDGARLWFDLQIRRPLLRNRLMDGVSYVVGARMYLACVDVATNETTRYRLRRPYSSWHYNVSPDGALLCGDGEGRYWELGRSSKWINLYRIDGKKLGTDRLCSMKDHSYTTAPNAHFTPDGRWVVFTSDMHGSAQVYAVSVE